MLNKIIPVMLGASFGIFVLLATTFSLKSLVLIFSASAMFFASSMTQNKKKFFLTLMIIDMDLYINVNIFRNPDIIATREGIQISVTTICLGILYLLWWLDIVTKRSEEIELFPKITVISIGYLLACLLSIYNSESILLSTFDIFYLLQMIMIFFYIANYMKYKDDVIYVIYVLAACLFIQSAIILVQYATGILFNLTGKISNVDTMVYFEGGRSIDVYRPVGTSGSPNETGGHIAILLPIVLSLLLYTKNRFKNILVGIVLLMGMVALLLTFSRGSWAGCAVGLVVFLIVALRYRWISAKKVVAMAVLIAVVLSIFSVPLAARLSQDDQGSASSRVPLMKLAFNMIQDHPFIGIGTNNFGIVLPHYLSSELRGEWMYVVHNQYLLVFSETGIIGLFFFLLIMAMIIHTCLRCLRLNDPFVSPLSTAILSGIIALLIFMTAELAISRLTVQLFWSMAAIVIALERFVRLDRQKFLNLSMPLKVER